MLSLTQILIHSSFISFYYYYFFIIIFYHHHHFLSFSVNKIIIKNKNKNKNGQKLGYNSCPLFIIFTMQRYWKILFSFSFV